MDFLKQVDNWFLIIVVTLLGIESVLSTLDRIGLLPPFLEQRMVARDRRLVTTTLDEVGLIPKKPLIRQLSEYWDVRTRTGILNLEAELMELLKLNTSRQPSNVKVGLYTKIGLKYYIDFANLTSEPEGTASLARLLGACIRSALASLDFSLQIDKIAAPSGNPALAFAMSGLLMKPLVLVDPKSANPSDPVHGKVNPGDHIVIVHDVLLTGYRIADVASILRSAGAQVTHVFALIERTDAARMGEVIPSVTLSHNSLTLHTILSIDDSGIEKVM